MKLEDIKTGYYLATQGTRKVCVYVGPDKWVSGEEDFFERAVDMLEDGWNFTRLVPSKEIEKAYLEGQEDGLKLANGSNTEYREWATSRAWRVAEGLE